MLGQVLAEGPVEAAACRALGRWLERLGPREPADFEHQLAFFRRQGYRLKTERGYGIAHDYFPASAVVTCPGRLASRPDRQIAGGSGLRPPPPRMTPVARPAAASQCGLSRRSIRAGASSAPGPAIPG